MAEVAAWLLFKVEDREPIDVAGEIWALDLKDPNSPQKWWVVRADVVDRLANIVVPVVAESEKQISKKIVSVIEEKVKGVEKNPTIMLVKRHTPPKNDGYKPSHLQGGDDRGNNAWG